MFVKQAAHQLHAMSLTSEALFERSGLRNLSLLGSQGLIRGAVLHRVLRSESSQLASQSAFLFLL